MGRGQCHPGPASPHRSRIRGLTIARTLSLSPATAHEPSQASCPDAPLANLCTGPPRAPVCYDERSACWAGSLPSRALLEPLAMNLTMESSTPTPAASLSGSSRSPTPSCARERSTDAIGAAAADGESTRFRAAHPASRIGDAAHEVRAASHFCSNFGTLPDLASHRRLPACAYLHAC